MYALIWVLGAIAWAVAGLAAIGFLAARVWAAARALDGEVEAARERLGPRLDAPRAVAERAGRDGRST